MTKIKFLIMIVGIMSFSTIIAQSKIEKTFARIDKNKDGKIDKKEFHNGKRSKAFKKIDENKDGKISFKEFSEKAHKRHHKKRR